MRCVSYLHAVLISQSLLYLLKVKDSSHPFINDVRLDPVFTTVISLKASQLHTNYRHLQLCKWRTKLKQSEADPWHVQANGELSRANDGWHPEDIRFLSWDTNAMEHAEEKTEKINKLPRGSANSSQPTLTATSRACPYASYLQSKSS